MKLCQSLVNIVLTLAGDDVGRDGVDDGAWHHGHGHGVEVVAAAVVVHHRRRAGGVSLDRDRGERDWRHGLKIYNI